jgi:hypothetical protein
MSTFVPILCQVSLENNIPLIKENYENFKKIYNAVKIYVVCPKSQIKKFQDKLNFKEIKIINEDQILSFRDFKKIFFQISGKISYQKKFNIRLKWYYQQILKILFAFKFIEKNKKLIIWDADTIILKKIDFYNKSSSISYGNFFEYNEAYYKTNKQILRIFPKYYISFLNQFISINKKDNQFLMKNIFKNKTWKKNLKKKTAKIILQNIFKAHNEYRGSMFSEYELIGQSNYVLNKSIQKPILFLRQNLDGKLTNFQKLVSKGLNFKHVTYEHKHLGVKNKGMLKRKQSTLGFVKIILKNLFTHYVKTFFHFLIFFYYSNDLRSNQIYKEIKKNTE